MGDYGTWYKAAIAFVLAISLAAPCACSGATEEMETMKSWIGQHLTRGGIVPFSFTYAGKSSADFIKDWKFTETTARLDEARTERVLMYSDPATGVQLRCECVIFSDFPAIEWVLKFRNTSDKDTPILENVQAIDVEFAAKQQKEFILRYARGSSATRQDFAPVQEVIKPDAPVNLGPVGGRSSDTVALPFFNVEVPGEGGVMLGIGWSGQWAASFSTRDGSSLGVKAGMELTHLKLHPGEEIRTPRIMLLFWQGDDYLRAHNQLRRFILAHHTLKKDGKPITMPFACSSSALYEESNKATEQNQLDFAPRFKQYGVEYHWIDAGWFEGRWPNGVGNWTIRKDGFPNGLRPVTDALKKMGMGLILWFEPERVYQGTWIDREHPEWVLKLPGNPNGLLNLGNPDARRWLTDHISGMIRNEGISVYRQDFNMDPLAFWRATDEPDRRGITEIRHVEGLYTFWDELLRRHPGLIIDNCASGGRRIDLETVSRSVALWRTDYQYFEPNGYQSHTYGISLYLPSTSTGNGYPDVYSFRSSMNNGLVLGWNVYQPDFPLEQARRLAAEFKRVRDFFYGDFYPLTPHSVEDDVWIAYQFHKEDIGQGIVLAFRRPKCAVADIRLKLRGLIPSAQYEILFEDTGKEAIFTGKDLANGLDEHADTAPSAVLISYRLRR